MASRRSASLARRFPHRADVPLLLTASAVLITLGLTLPAIETHTLVFWRAEYSIAKNIGHLNAEGKVAAASILAICSVLYPLVKLMTLFYFWLMPFPHAWRARVITVLRLLGRWALIDVFAVTAIVLGSLTIGPFDATPKTGLYLFACGVLLLMFATLLMDRLARHGR